MILLSNAIHTEGLTKYYGKARGILDLNLSVEQGEFFGFIGPNGAGKSTTIRTLLGLISPNSGRASVLGLEIHRQREAILRQVGYLPSETAYDSGMRVQELLRLSAALRKADCRQEAEQLCQRLQLDPSQRVDDLSYGNRKKVAIVCALQSKPRLLILDEPTGGLDPLIQHEFFKLLQERKQQGATVFLSSHVLSEIQHNCERAAVIREGRLIACDRVEKLARTNAKQISLRGQVDLQGLEGLRNLRSTEQGCSFLYSGDINALLQRLSGGKIQDLSIAEPDLEEIFLHYYQKEGEAE